MPPDYPTELIVQKSEQFGLVMNSNGSYAFSGQLNNSNYLPYTMNIIVAIRSSKGAVFTFSASGNIDAGLPWDNNNWSFNNAGTNASIATVWADLLAGWTWRGNASATLNVGAVWNAVQQAFQEAGLAISTVIAIVGVLS